MRHDELRGGKNQKAGGVYPRGNLSSLPPEVVLKPNDIVLSEIGSALNLDENKSAFPYVFNPMSHARKDVDRLTLTKDDFFSIQSDPGTACDGHPMLRTMSMFLITQALSGQDFNTFDLVGSGFVEDCESSPRPPVESGGLVSCILHVEDCTARAFDPAIA
jgi:hypothetical protein